MGLQGRLLKILLLVANLWSLSERVGFSSKCQSACFAYFSIGKLNKHKGMENEGGRSLSIEKPSIFPIPIDTPTLNSENLTDYKIAL